MRTQEEVSVVKLRPILKPRSSYLKKSKKPAPKSPRKIAIESKSRLLNVNRLVHTKPGKHETHQKYHQYKAGKGLFKVLGKSKDKDESKDRKVKKV